MRKIDILSVDASTQKISCIEAPVPIDGHLESEMKMQVPCGIRYIAYCKLRDVAAVAAVNLLWRQSRKRFLY